MSMSKIVSQSMRSSTPEPSFPLTPPPTGGFGGSGGKPHTKIAAQRTNKASEGESLTEYFEELQEGSDVDNEGIHSRRSSISTVSNSVPATSTSSTAVIPKGTSPHLQEAFEVAEITSAPPVSEPFPFLKLPVFTRNRIYGYLLVVPGLICIRQNQTIVLQENDINYLHAQERQLLPGIANASVRVTVNSRALQFSRVGSINVNILLVSKEVFAQAKTILYSKNDFEIVKPSNELSPPPDFSVRLFPSGCQRLVTKLNIRIRSFYDLAWLWDGGHVHIKNFYRGLKTLTLILELASNYKGFGRMWARQVGEKWDMYVQRLREYIAKDAFRGREVKGKGKGKVVPGWIKLKVVFEGESYVQGIQVCKNDIIDTVHLDKRDELRDGLQEAWEPVKKGGR